MENVERKRMVVPSPSQITNIDEKAIQARGYEFLSDEEKKPLWTNEKLEIGSKIAMGLGAFLGRYGGPRIELAKDMIEVYRNNTSNTLGSFNPTDNRIYLNEEIFRHDAIFAHVLSHEAVHSNAISISIREEDDSMNFRRRGLVMNLHSSRFKHEWDKPDDQAYYKNIRKFDMLHSQYGRRLQYIDEGLVDMVALSLLNALKLSYINPSSYKASMKMVELTCESMQENSNLSKLEAFNLFVNAEFESALPLVKKFEKIYGRGSFYKFAELTDAVQDRASYLERVSDTKNGEPMLLLTPELEEFGKLLLLKDFEGIYVSSRAIVSPNLTSSRQ